MNPAVAESCRAEFHAQRAETDWRRVVAAPDIDVCLLATHQEFRGEFIIPALEAGQSVYTEKPLAPRREEMLRIARAARQTKRPVCVGHNRRSGPAVLEFKRLLDKARQTTRALPPSVDRSDGRAVLPEERVLQLLIRVNDDIRSWKAWGYTDAEGILFSEMVHFIDLALWCNAAAPVRGFAEGSCRGNFALVLRFADGSITNFHHTMVGHLDYPKELFEASTRNVTVVLDHHLEVRQFGLADEPVQQFFPAGGRGLHEHFETLAAELERVRATGQAIPWLPVNKGHAAHLDRFLDHLEGRGPNPCDIESAVAVNCITLKLLESIRLGLPVAISPEDWHLP